MQERDGIESMPKNLLQKFILKEYEAFSEIKRLLLSLFSLFVVVVVGGWMSTAFEQMMEKPFKYVNFFFYNFFFLNLGGKLC